MTVKELAERLEQSRMALWAHGLITDAENNRIRDGVERMVKGRDLKELAT